jgi:hypothetical protein
MEDKAIRMQQRHFNKENTYGQQNMQALLDNYHAIQMMHHPN